MRIGCKKACVLKNGERIKQEIGGVRMSRKEAARNGNESWAGSTSMGQDPAQKGLMMSTQLCINH